MKRIIFVMMICMLSITAETVTKQRVMRTLTKNEDVQKGGGAAKKKCNNLICLFDSHQSEAIFGSPFVLFHLMWALQEKVAPIIVTTNIVEHFCYWKTHTFEVIKNNLSTSFWKTIIYLAISTNLKGWECYFHKRSGLMLLVPKKYIETHITTQGLQTEDPILQCGFAVENLEKIKTVSYSKIVEYVQNHTPMYDRIVDDFESMFIKNVNPLTVWNIFIAGHGSSATEIEIEKTSEQKINNSIKQVQSRIQQIQQRQSDDYEEELNLAKKELRVLLRQLKHVRSQGVSWQVGRGSVAGLGYQSFISLMEFFEHGIKASYVHYSTCFAGGFNQTLMNQELASLNVNFIVSNQGINESVSYGPNITGSQFASFFAKLEALMCGQIIELAKDQEAVNVLIKDSIAEIVESIIYRPMLDYTQPFVRIPSAGVFKALEIDEKVKLLTHSLVRAHEVEGTDIDYTDSSAVTILIYPSYVPVTVKIKDHVAIVSPAPQSLKEMQKPTIHIFEKMFYQDSLFSIIPNFASFNTRDQRITFVIKELHCLDSRYLSLGAGENKPIVIKDMIIQMYPPMYHLIGYFWDTFIDVVFSYNNKNYAISMPWFDPNTKSLFNAFKQGKLDIIADENLIRVAKNIIGESGIATLEKKKKKITLSSIVEYFMEQITRPLHTKKAKDSQHFVLLKKIKKIERITTDVALKMQREFVVKTEFMPGVAWMHRLERLLGIAQDTLDYIKRLMVGKQDDVILLSCKEKVENVLKILTQEYESAGAQLSWKEWSFMKVEPISEKVQEIRNTMIHRIEQLRVYMWGEEEQQRYGYGRWR